MCLKIDLFDKIKNKKEININLWK